jgi:hypothetical protein
MPPRALCIAFANLPPRSRRLTASELSDVFGGSCIEIGKSCTQDGDCCKQDNSTCISTDTWMGKVCHN